MRNILLQDELSGGSHGSEDAPLRPVAGATTPYWRTHLHPIDEHRSSTELPSECDVVIIGAGLSGVSTAYHLSKAIERGSHVPSIVMLEARQVCSGATGRNGGHVKCKVDGLLSRAKKNGASAAEEFAAFVNEQIYALKEVVEREELDCEFEMRRSFDVFLDDVEAENIARDFRASIAAGHKYTRDRALVDEKTAEQVTSLRGAKVAVSSPCCSFWPYKFVTQLLAKLVDRGVVNLQTNTPVTSVRPGDEGCSNIETARGSIRARKVVFATNGYTSGLCSQYKDTVIPYKGTACHITPQKGPVSPHLSHTYNISYPPGPAKTDYLNPRPDGGIVVGGAKWEFEGARSLWYRNWDDSTLLPGAKGHFDILMQRYFKGWEDSDAQVDHIWTGIQALTPDTMPHVGKVVGVQGGQQYLLAGFNGGGNAMCFLCARGIAEMVLHDANFDDTGLPKMFESTKVRLQTTPEDFVNVQSSRRDPGGRVMD